MGEAPGCGSSRCQSPSGILCTSQVLPPPCPGLSEGVRGRVRAQMSVWAWPVGWAAEIQPRVSAPLPPNYHLPRETHPRPHPCHHRHLPVPCTAPVNPVLASPTDMHTPNFKKNHTMVTAHRVTRLFFPSCTSTGAGARVEVRLQRPTAVAGCLGQRRRRTKGPQSRGTGTVVPVARKS